MSRDRAPVTPSLFVDERPGRPDIVLPEQAAALIEVGERAVVGEWNHARQVLGELGLAEDWVEARIRYAQTGTWAPPPARR